MIKQRKWLTQGLKISGVALLAWALSTPVSAAEGDAIKLVKPGTLTVCSHLPYKPFESVDEKGDVVGFDVDLAQMLADDLDVAMNVISIEWNQIITGLVFKANKCDIAMGGATITDERKEAVLFSEPYFNSTQGLLVRTDSGIKDLDDLKGKRFGVQISTTGQIYADKRADKYGYQTVIFDDLALLTSAVSAGSVAAGITDAPPLQDYADNHPETEVATAFDTGERLGFITQKDDDNATRLMDRFNELLAEAHEDGSYDDIYHRWFGDLPMLD